MNYLARFTAIGALTASLLFPLSAYALIPVGGKVIFETPCLGGIFITVANAGLGSGSFIYAPGTLTYPFGPPTPNSWVLGLSDAPIVCKPYLAPRITFIGSWFGIPSASVGEGALSSAHGLY